MLRKLLVALATAAVVVIPASPAFATHPKPSHSVSVSASASPSASVSPSVSASPTKSPSTTASPTATPTTGSTATTEVSPVPAGESLPVTGPSVGFIIFWGVLVLVVGVVLYFLFRKPKRQDFRP